MKPEVEEAGRGRRVEDEELTAGWMGEERPYLRKNATEGITAASPRPLRSASS